MKCTDGIHVEVEHGQYEGVKRWHLVNAPLMDSI